MRERWGALPPYPQRVLIHLACLPFLIFTFFTAIFLCLEIWPDRDDPTIADDIVSTPALCEDFPEIPACKGSWERYEDFWSRILTLDLGTSFINNRPVSESLRLRWRVSVELLVMICLTAATTALAMSVPVAKWPRPPVKTGTVVLTALISACPAVAVAYASLIYPVEWWDYAPPIGDAISFFDDPLGNLKQFLVPSLVVGIILGGWSSRLMRRHIAVDMTPRTIAVGAASVLADIWPWALGSLLLVEFLYTLPGRAVLLPLHSPERCLRSRGGGRHCSPGMLIRMGDQTSAADTR